MPVYGIAEACFPGWFAFNRWQDTLLDIYFVLVHSVRIGEQANKQTAQQVEYHTSIPNIKSAQPSCSQIARPSTGGEKHLQARVYDKNKNHKDRRKKSQQHQQCGAANMLPRVTSRRCHAALACQRAFCRNSCSRHASASAAHDVSRCLHTTADHFARRSPSAFERVTSHWRPETNGAEWRSCVTALCCFSVLCNVSCAVHVWSRNKMNIGGFPIHLEAFFSGRIGNFIFSDFFLYFLPPTPITSESPLYP